MSHDGALLEKAGQAPAGLTPREDARAMVRLLQCSHCSKPFRNPITLPCGNSLCRECLPQTHQRENISYPDLPGRRQGLECPFPDCGLEHPASDCNVDVTLTKAMDAIAETMAKHASTLGTATMMVEQVLEWDETNQSSEKHIMHEVPSSRLVAAYLLAAQGALSRNADLLFQDGTTENGNIDAIDDRIFQDLLLSTQREVDCQVCYSIMLDPVTTFCGHTLCRNCLKRVLDHSLHCPICRRSVATDPSLQNHASNKILVDLLDRLYPELIAARAEAVASEEQATGGRSSVPLFVCTLGFPNQPTFLRIFEPRYKLMLRRCLEGNRQFGMLMYNKYGEPQGDLGPVHFFHYGTMLEIVQADTMMNGESVIETRGVYRFRVKSHGVMDGYSVGDIERIDDVSLAEEERIEAEETSVPATETDTLEEQIKRMSTQALLELGHGFIERMQHRSATWLQQRFLNVHGTVPSDPAIFPYWFASVLPISEEEKYKLLGTRTVRERLKITAGWIRRIESQRW